MVAKIFLGHETMTGPQAECMHVDTGERVGREQHDARTRRDLTQARPRLQHRMRTGQAAGVDKSYGVIHGAMMPSGSN